MLLTLGIQTSSSIDRLQYYNRPLRFFNKITDPRKVTSYKIGFCKVRVDLNYCWQYEPMRELRAGGRHTSSPVVQSGEKIKMRQMRSTKSDDGSVRSDREIRSSRD